MKKLLPILFIASIAMPAIQACKEKKQSEADIITTKYVAHRPPQAPVRLSADKRETDVSWLGRQYAVMIERMPADSLPMVADESGQKYVDNSIKLTVRRSDSTVVFLKHFTKNSFASYLDNDYRHRGILESMVFRKADGPELKFTVVVSHPEADDEFIAMEMSLNGEGGVSIQQANLLDEGDREGID